LPIIFIKGIVGVLFKELGLVIIFVLLASLFCALLFTPMLSGQLLRPLNVAVEEKFSRFHRWFVRTEAWFDALSSRYVRTLSWALQHRAWTIGGGVLIFLLSMMLFLVIKTEFLPEMDQGNVQGTIEMPVGTRMEVTDAMLRHVEEYMRNNVPESDVYLTRSGTSPFAGIGLAFGQEQGSNYARIVAHLIPKRQRKRSDKQIAHDLSEKIMQLPGVRSVDFTQADPFSSAMVGGKPISVEIYGYDLTETDSLAQRVKRILQGIRGTMDITISRKMGQPELWIEIDRQKASRLGLNVAAISSAIRTLMFGANASYYRERGQEYDIWVQLNEASRSTLNDLKQLQLVTPLGKTVSLASIANFHEAKGPVELHRKDQERVVRVECGIYGRALGEVAKELRQKLAGLYVPPGYEIKLSGAIEQQATAFHTLLYALVMGALLVYLVMAAQFESLIDPFVIMFSIPFAIVGVAWALFLTGTSLNVNSFVGMVMLVGIVVNNAIVLVDYTNIVRRRGVDLIPAVLEAGKTRLRPVMMTAFTTIFGLLPLALSRAEGSEMWVPLGVSVIGGLLVSTLVTLIFVPTLYTVFELRLKGKSLFRQIRETL
ncbi:MAG TPA: efflux RND transporter permease subunit, partial [Bacteroidetes bacterium]|nr:efflux RND transporter permease subunit [Bacteroidota bacterium]